MSDTATDVITITQGAAAKARSLAQREGLAEPYLRIRIVAGGCSGFSYRLSFDREPRPEDQLVEGYGLRVVIDPKTVPLIQGSILDFNDSLLGGGLKVRNPQAIHECACGESFTV